jgi:hypothetical protein
MSQHLDDTGEDLPLNGHPAGNGMDEVPLLFDHIDHIDHIFVAKFASGDVRRRTSYVVVKKGPHTLPI